MIRDERYKLSIYHGHDYGELYDMQNDPHEFENLWDSAAHTAKKLNLLNQSFQSTVAALANQMPILPNFPNKDKLPRDFHGLKKLLDDMVIAMNTGPDRIGRY